MDDHRRQLALASLFLPSGSVSLRDFASGAGGGAVDLRACDLPRLFERAMIAPSFKSGVTDRVLRASEFYQTLGAEILYPFHEDYPASFYELERPPLFLSVLGRVDALHASQRLAVVGSRELSTRTERWLELHLSDFLKACPQVCIVSGGARGADQSAHLAAIRAGRPTVVFLPSGLNSIFPRNLESWVKPVLECGGAFVSAYAPDDEVRRHRFEARNRLIASLSHLVFIAEAGRRSGTMMTARLSAELGRHLCVLPSFPGELVGQGSLELLKQGREIICDAKDLIARMWACTPTPHQQSLARELRLHADV